MNVKETWKKKLIQNNIMKTDPYKQHKRRTVTRTVQYIVYADSNANKGIVATYDDQREAYNRAIESQLEHPGWVDPKLKSPKTPNGILGQLPMWRQNGELHEGVLSVVHRPPVIDARWACEQRWKSIAKKMERIFNFNTTQEWIKSNPEHKVDWNKLKFEDKRNWIRKALDNGLELSIRDTRNLFNDKKLFRRAKDGIKTVISHDSPKRIDSNTLQMQGEDYQLHVKCPKGLPPQNRIKSMCIVPRGIHRDMRKPELLRFKVHLSVEVDIIEVPASDKILGIDRGITDTLALSNGKCWSYPINDEDIVKRQKITDKKDALDKDGHRERQTRKWKYTLKALRKINKRIKYSKHTALYEYTKSLMKKYGVIALEDLKVKNMMGRRRGKGARSKAGLNRKLSDAAFGYVSKTITIVCENHGRLPLSLPYGYSSQTCFKCKYVHKENMNKKKFKCLSCGHENDRDINAAKNMKQRAKIYRKSRNDGSTNGVAIKAVNMYISKTRGKDRCKASREPRDLNIDKLQVEDVQRGRLVSLVCTASKPDAQTSHHGVSVIPKPLTPVQGAKLLCRIHGELRWFNWEDMMRHGGRN